MHHEINSPVIRLTVQSCVFRPGKSPMRTLYEHISHMLMVKFIN